MTVFATASVNGGEPVIEIFIPRMPNHAVEQSLYYARGVIRDAFAEIGVGVVWGSAASSPSGCSQEPLHQKIVVALQPTTPAYRTKNAVAFSNPYLTQGPCVTLLMDRIQPSAQANPINTGFLLGNVLAHEVGHILQRIARHSETGVMKESWSWPEMMSMRTNRLHFTAYDAQLIREVFTSPKILRAGENNHEGP
jgi:hypothetical protein